MMTIKKKYVDIFRIFNSKSRLHRDDLKGRVISEGKRYFKVCNLPQSITTTYSDLKTERTNILYPAHAPY